MYGLMAECALGLSGGPCFACLCPSTPETLRTSAHRAERCSEQWNAALAPFNRHYRPAISHPSPALSSPPISKVQKRVKVPAARTACSTGQGRSCSL